jgi:hypothetical protein
MADCTVLLTGSNYKMFPSKTPTYRQNIAAAFHV